MPRPSHSVTPIVPCNDIDASERFYARLGFVRNGYDDEYRILQDGEGGEIHLQPAVAGWVVPGRNPFGIYIATRRVREIAEIFDRVPEQTEYGSLETAPADPDETLVRVGWPVGDERTAGNAPRTRARSSRRGRSSHPAPPRRPRT
jgi:hypothetical protein